MQRAAQPDEIAPSYVFFASDRASSYYSGEVLAPVGGLTMPGRPAPAAVSVSAARLPHSAVGARTVLPEMVHWMVVTISVWMDSWQLQCCGEPTRVDARFSWRLDQGRDLAWLADVLAPAVVRVDAAEDHHGTVAASTSGTVTRIRLLRCRFDPAPVPGSGQLSDVDEIVKWVDDRDDLRFAGYIVALAEDPHA